MIQKKVWCKGYRENSKGTSKQSKETLITGFYYLVLYVSVVYVVSLFLYVLFKKNHVPIK